MKKMITLMLIVVTLMSLFATSALADTQNRAFGLTAQCVSENNSNYGISSGNAHRKDENNNYIEIRHNVIGTGSSSGFTNYMMAYQVDFRAAYGGKFMASNGLYYSTNNSSSIHQGGWVKPAARGNTKFNQTYGLASVRLEGQFRPR